MRLKERLVGAILLTLMAPLVIASLLVSVIQVLVCSKERLTYCMSTMSRYINTTLLKGSPLESISGHSWRVRDSNLAARTLVFLLDSLEKNHCRISYYKDKLIRKIVEEQQ